MSSELHTITEDVRRSTVLYVCGRNATMRPLLRIVQLRLSSWITEKLAASFHDNQSFPKLRAVKKGVGLSFTMKRRNVRTLSLIVVTFTYLLIGAAVFDVLEGDHNEKAFDGLQQIQRNFQLKYNMTDLDYRMLELIIIEKEPHKAGPQWKFVGSFYYAFVVLALIGYGHSTPKTALGKENNNIR